MNSLLTVGHWGIVRAEISKDTSKEDLMNPKNKSSTSSSAASASVEMSSIRSDLHKQNHNHIMHNKLPDGMHLCVGYHIVTTCEYMMHIII